MLGAGDLERGRQRNGAVLHRLDQALLALFQKEDSVADVFLGEARTLDDIFKGVIACLKQLDVRQNFRRAMAAPGNVFRQRHVEGILVTHVDHQRWDVVFAKQAEGVQSPFAANQQIGGRAIGALARGHCDGLLETDGADVFHDLFEDLHVAVSRVQNLDAVYGNKRDALGCVSHHVGIYCS